ncbi:thiol:disulfide interchange protein DsbD [Solimonas aquatica]|uniref:Thiol:disulfide interchange protein DsbD n=1 Tax=Solimonas aquatica TaxID=489703 RepID=A0A1H9GUV6_9GAMM|nr:protein-disulfide reductase DsbD domain-containing protein [Solimonas aquatica]SEQ53857.1 thiol:disulfide interchange protein DsbD [Solimonas aquatica]
MSTLARTLVRLLILMLMPLSGLVAAQTQPVQAELLSENQTLRAGAENMIALRLKPQAGWHVYWRNPGDSGIATKLEWQLPAGVQAGQIQWPYPHQFRLGELVNYGYGAETLHLVPLTLDAGVRGPLTLKATAKWLVCKDLCIPGKAELSLTLPVAAQAQTDPRLKAAFAQARAQLPQSVDWPAQYQVQAGDFSLAVQSPSVQGASRISFFPYAADLINHAAAQRQQLQGAQLRLSQALNAYYVAASTPVQGLLLIDTAGDARAYEITARAGSVPALPKDSPAQKLQAAPEGGDEGAAPAPMGLLAVFVFALLGGLVLNLMPCVFPVLSLKALSIARAGPAQQRGQALAYTAGVIASCVGAAAAILLLRSAGEAVGWGFQLQSPAFVAVLCYLLFALGLSLSGAAEFGSGLMNVGQNLTERKGWSGAFFTGVLAVVVASPCTAPFMGTAIGFAMTQPPPLAIAVFAALGLGLALPFLLIGFVPAAARLLPKPGAWMERFKQAMAFPLYLSVVWLLWVLARQLDINASAQIMVGLVLLAFILWLWRAHGLLASLFKLAAFAGAIGLVVQLPPAQAPQAAAAQAGSERQAWSTARVAELRAEGRTVFVDFTADWCLSCKVNERVALNNARVQQAFAERGVAVLVADWTRADPAITAELARFGRNGVPLYLVYAKGGEARILPQLLTPDIVLKALD